jgi:drug/metabolite transporter (DMT)-like permease
MKPLNVFLLFLLGILWGGSFIFMRYLAPIFGAVLTADMRILIGGSVLSLMLILFGIRLDWRKHWRRYTVIGLLNSGAPFLLYSFAALHIPGSVSSIINSLAPVFGALFSALWLGDRLSLRKVSGLAAGVAGVSVITSADTIERTLSSYLAVGACVLATVCYGLAGVYIKRKAAGIRPRVLAATSQVIAGFIILPFAFVAPPAAPVTARAVAILAAFGVLCSGLAYLIYYKLIRDDGPTRALTVSFIIPVFGILFGRLFLAESLTWSMALGVVIVLTGTGLVVLPGLRRRLEPAASPRQR